MNQTRIFRRLVPTAMLLAVALFCGLTPNVADAQLQTSAEQGEELTIYVMTMGPGAAVWERFGHNAIWIRDSLRGTDIAYNYGMFSFDQENFILRFIQGEMNYWMEGFDANATADFYMQQGRSVWAQELNLTPDQRVELRDFLEWNSLPENRFYRYDYYLDNCSTRVRDVIDQVLGGQIRAQTDTVASGTTFRDHTRQLTAPDPLLYTGLMVGLGQPVDRPISVWEEMFLPMQLRDHLRDVTIAGSGGAPLPLVRSEQEIYVSPSNFARVDRSARIGGYLFGGVVLALGLLATAYYRPQRRDAAVAFRILSMGWAGLAGILGLVLVVLWAFTDHAAAYRNENLMLFNPLHFALLLLLPWISTHRPRVLKAAFWLATLIAISSVASVVLGILPAFYQENAELIALAAPPNIALFVAFWMIIRISTGAGLPSMPRRRLRSSTV